MVSANRRPAPPGAAPRLPVDTCRPTSCPRRFPLAAPATPPYASPPCPPSCPPPVNNRLQVWQQHRRAAPQQVPAVHLRVQVSAASTAAAVGLIGARLLPKRWWSEQPCSAANTALRPWLHLNPALLAASAHTSRLTPARTSSPPAPRSPQVPRVPHALPHAGVLVHVVRGGSLALRTAAGRQVACAVLQDQPAGAHLLPHCRAGQCVATLHPRVVQPGGGPHSVPGWLQQAGQQLCQATGCCCFPGLQTSRICGSVDTHRCPPDTPATHCPLPAARQSAPPHPPSPRCWAT